MSEELKDERAAFEAWARVEFFLPADGLKRHISDDNYKYSGVADAWAGWQAGRAAQPQAANDKKQTLTDEEQIKAMVDLERFLDVAAGEGYEFDGVDAGELFLRLFPDHYAIKSAPQAPAASEERQPLTDRDPIINECINAIYSIDEACTGATMQVNAVNRLRALLSRAKGE
jgi:hypothetical protein